MRWKILEKRILLSHYNKHGLEKEKESNDECLIIDESSSPTNSDKAVLIEENSMLKKRNNGA